MDMFIPGMSVSCAVRRRRRLWNRNLTWDFPMASLALGERNGSTRRGGHALDYLVNLAPLLDKTSLLKSMLCATRFPLTIPLGSWNLEGIVWNLGSLGNPLFRAKHSIFENVGVPEIRKGIASNSFLFLPHPWEKGSVVALEEHKPGF